MNRPSRGSGSRSELQRPENAAVSPPATSASSSSSATATATATESSSSATAAAGAPNGRAAAPQPPGPPTVAANKSGPGGPGDVIDAGMRSLGHYKRALPRWRYRLRQSMLPLIRWETPYLAYMQDKMRSPALDSYFATTANLGTHTFFMIFLPILFWCGFREFGRGLVHILASGVFFTGFVKDMLSLPRPLSPPLNRITMSGSAALEYGFPSTHSANAVSVAVLAILMLRDPTNSLAPTTRMSLEALSYFYAASIVFGRLYCGMHGFLDVIVGSVMGITISLVEFFWVPAIEAVGHETGWRAPIYFALAIIVLVRIHPEPADDCPCFDDSVAFAGVMIGLEIGAWHYGRRAEVLDGSRTFSVAELSLPVVAARLASGILVIFAWREVMKPAMLTSLPYLFRVLETLELSLPRRFFARASEYQNIPDLLRLHTDTVIPSVSEIPNMVRNIRRVGKRGRSVSIGPQSAADAYETLAYRERRRRESAGSHSGLTGKPSLSNLREEGRHLRASPGPGGAVTDSAVVGGDVDEDAAGTCSHATGLSAGPQAAHNQHHHASTLAEYEAMMGQGTVVVADNGGADGEEPDLFVARQDELGEKEMFEKLVKPRVKYDVEVVTKLVVYTGIAWLSVEGIPVMFEYLGLGVGHLRPAR